MCKLCIRYFFFTLKIFTIICCFFFFSTPRLNARWDDISGTSVGFTKWPPGTKKAIWITHIHLIEYRNSWYVFFRLGAVCSNESSSSSVRQRRPKYTASCIRTWHKKMKNNVRNQRCWRGPLWRAAGIKKTKQDGWRGLFCNHPIRSVLLLLSIARAVEVVESCTHIMLCKSPVCGKRTRYRGGRQMWKRSFLGCCWFTYFFQFSFYRTTPMGKTERSRYIFCIECTDTLL